MCWSKGDPDSPPQQPTTTSRQMGDNKLKCPVTSTTCGTEFPGHCANGICCIELDHSAGGRKPFCVCHNLYYGDHCDLDKVELSRLILERTMAIAAVSAILGVLVIALFVVLIALQVKYYRHRRKRLNKNDHEMSVIPKSPGGGGSMINQPGYSWRESVRRSSKAYQKLQGPSSRSVPDDLFKMGITIALFNLKACEQKNEGRGVGGGGKGGGGPDPVDRCLSADAGGRGRDGGGGGGGSTVGFGSKTTHSPAIKDSGQERIPLTRREGAEDQ